jgi:uncharacterized protein YukE
MLKPRLSAFLSLFFVFLSGALVGTLGYRYYAVNYGNPSLVQRKGPSDPAEVRRHIVAEMAEALKLDSSQVEQVGKILDETRSSFKDLHDKYNREGHELWQQQIEQINQILRPEQRPLYQQLREKHEKEREERKKKRDRERGITEDTAKK